MTAVREPDIRTARRPGSMFGQVADLVLSSDDTDQSVRWAPGERLQHLFEQNCDRFRVEGDSGQLAVSRGDLAITYDELDARANQMARFLGGRGVGPGHRVGLILDDPVTSYVAVLATLKIHAAYVPLDASFPPDRVAFIVNDAGVGTVLTLSHLRDRVADVTVEVICIDEVQERVDALDPSRLDRAEQGVPVDELCYIIYTSGTTGRPKGVAIEHAAIVNFVRVAAEVYGVEPRDRMYQGMTIAFDFSVEEIWVALVVGATLVPKPGRNLLGEELAEFLRDEHVTALCCVPTLLATMDDDLPDLRFLLVSGEACPQDLVSRWYRPERRFLNVYGPTEATVTATWTTLHPDQPVTIGVPLPTYSVVILDEHHDGTLPAGQRGEIGIAGICLSPGYVNRDDVTEKVFRPDAIGIPNNTSGRIYRTGDLGRITDEGRIEYLGRIDTQVKIRGYRIELTEIESLILQSPGVAQAVVDTHEPAPGATELVAYYTQRRSDPPVDVDVVNEVLRDRLPTYMVPAYFEHLDRMPMLPSDKVDRKNLPAPQGPRRLAVQGEIVEPEGELEQALAAAVASQLGLEQVSVQSNFFDELGMSSLLMAQLSARIRKDPALPPVGTKDMYLNPTVRALAAALKDAAPRGARSPREVRVASTAQYVFCGVLQLLALLGAGGVLALLVAGGYTWMAASTGLVDGYLRAVSFGSGAFVALSVLPVIAKWVLIGRWKPGRIPIWSLGYFRFWVVSRLLAASPMVLFAGSPLYLVYLRALGATVGRGVAVFARRLPVCTDLLTIGDGAVVRKDSIINGYHAESGWIRTGRVNIGRDAVVGEASVLDVDTSLGDGAQLGHASTLRTGQAVPAGRRYAGSPAEETGTDFLRVERRDVSSGRRLGYSVFQLLVLGLISAPLVTAALYVLLPAAYRTVVPALTGGGAWTTPAFYLGYLAVSTGLILAVMLLRLAAVLTLPRLFDRFVAADTVYRLYGVHYLCHRAVNRLSNSVVFNDLLGDSSFIVPFLRAVGYDLSPVRQTGSNFGLAVKHESPTHTRVGTGTLVSDGLSIGNTEYSGSTFMVSRVSIGTDNFLGNNITYPAQSTVGDNVLLATKVMVPIEGPRRENTGLLGSPAFEIPRSTQRDDTLDRYATGPEFTKGLAGKNRSNLATMGAFLLQRFALAYGTVLVGLAAITFLAGLGFAAYAIGIVAALVFGTLFSILVERSAMGFRRLRPQSCSIYQSYYWRHERLWKLSRITYLTLFDGTPFKGVLWRLAGVRVGRKVFDDGAIIPEKTLVTIGDHATLNLGAIIQCHSLEDASFKSDTTTVGDGVTLGTNSFVHYGVTVGDRVVIDADSFLMKGEEPSTDSRWRGNPALEVPEPDAPDREIEGAAAPAPDAERGATLTPATDAHRDRGDGHEAAASPRRELPESEPRPLRAAPNTGTVQRQARAPDDRWRPSPHKRSEESPGFRVDEPVRLAEQQAADIYALAAQDAASILQQARAQAEQHHHEIEQNLTARSAMLDRHHTRRAAELHEREQQLAAQFNTARVELRAQYDQAARDTARQHRQAHHDAAAIRAQAERDIGRQRQQADQEIARLHALLDGAHSEIRRVVRLLPSGPSTPTSVRTPAPRARGGRASATTPQMRTAHAATRDRRGTHAAGDPSTTDAQATDRFPPIRRRPQQAGPEARDRAVGGPPRPRPRPRPRARDDRI